MEFGKTAVAGLTAVVAFIGGAAFKNTFDAFFGYQKLTLDQHRQVLDILKLHNDIRKADSTGIATKYIIVMGETNVLPADVANKIANFLAEDTPGAEAKAAVAAATIKLPDSGPSAPPPPPPTTGSAVTGRLFVQISSDTQRGLFDPVRQALVPTFPNLVLPPLEVRDDYKGGTELRYFLPDDAPAAQLLLAELRKKLNGVRCARVHGYEKRGVRSGLLELWIGPGAAAGADPAATPCSS
jgi:hypothetical protein